MLGLTNYLTTAQSLRLTHAYLSAWAIVLAPWLLLWEQPAVEDKTLQWD